EREVAEDQLGLSGIDELLLDRRQGVGMEGRAMRAGQRGVFDDGDRRIGLPQHHVLQPGVGILGLGLNGKQPGRQQDQERKAGTETLYIFHNDTPTPYMLRGIVWVALSGLNRTLPLSTRIWPPQGVQRFAPRSDRPRLSRAWRRERSSTPRSSSASLACSSAVSGRVAGRGSGGDSEGRWIGRCFSRNPATA